MFLKKNQQLFLTTTIKMPSAQDQIQEYKNANPQAVSLILSLFYFINIMFGGYDIEEIQRHFYCPHARDHVKITEEISPIVLFDKF